MPIRISRACGILISLALLTMPAWASAATKPVDLRVATSHNHTTLADFEQYTGTAHFEATKKAKCFGPDNPSTNSIYTAKGATLLGALLDAAQHRHSLNPVQITDAFVDDGFGVGVCTVGVFTGPYGFPAPYWYGAVNGVGASTGPDLTPLRAGDQALWYFTNGAESGFPTELVLTAPVSAPANTPIPVHVDRISAADGTASPAAGVLVTGAGAETDTFGNTTVGGVGAGSELHLRAFATSADDIDSAKEDVCIEGAGSCPSVRGKTIFGSGRKDLIKGTRGDDTVNAGGDDDTVDISQGGSDAVACAGGNDKVVGAGSNDHVNPSCEVVKH